MARDGNPDNLRAAARRKHADAVQRAEKALLALVRNGEPVRFRAVARLAECSPDFLYRTPALRARIEQLRTQPLRIPPQDRPEDSTSAVIRALAVQLADVKERGREEVRALEEALAAAQGEILELRRLLGPTAGRPRTSR